MWRLWDDGDDQYYGQGVFMLRPTVLLLTEKHTKAPSGNHSLENAAVYSTPELVNRLLPSICPAISQREKWL
jgi:hypothetical protein